MIPLTADLNFIIGPLSHLHPHPWADTVANDVGLQRGRDYPVSFSADTSADQWTFRNYYYYDLGRVLYIQYYRTGNPEFLTLARKCTDSWWTYPEIDSGRKTTYFLAPRDAAISGLILRALDGRPEYFDWITNYVDYQFKSWVLDRIDNPWAVPGGGNEITRKFFMYDVREPGYMLIYKASLAKVHPDPAQRELFKQQCLRGVHELFAARQRDDGSFRYYHDSYTPNLLETEHPFTDGLLLEGLILVHRLTGDAITRTCILKAVDHLTSLYRRDPVTDVPGVIWRGFPNRWGGGDVDHPWVCEQPIGCRDIGHNPPGVLSVPSETANMAEGSSDLVREARQYATMTLHAYGYAYQLTGDAKYKVQGDEIQDACFSGADGFRCHADAPNTPKVYNQAFRSSLTYPARVGVPGPLPPVPPVLQPCTLSGPDSITVRRNSTGVINLNVSGVTGTIAITHSGSDGQVQVTPASRTATATSNVLAFQVKVKRQGRTIVFQSPCGSKSVQVIVQ